LRVWTRGLAPIALTPRNEMTKKAIAAADLTPRNGRLLLDAAIASPVDRLTQTEKTLRTVAR